jgi:PadR family transcriptional regulator PadR
MRIGRFVVPCLLLLLHERSAHAYDLLKGLERLTGDASVDPSVVYRRLQQMEQRGWVRSAWDDDSLGPPRKVYHLTDEGDHQLRLWVQDVEELSQLLHAMVLEYQEHMETGVGAHH